MTIDFSKRVTNNSLNLSYDATIFSDTNQFNDLIKFINNNSNITQVNLQKCDIKIDKLKLLVEALKKSNITHLDVSNNNIGAEGAAEIGKLSNLTNLNIGENNIGDEGAAEIGKLSNLTNLWIWGNKISNDGASAIANLSNLTTLHIDNNLISDKGTLEIANKLLYLTKLGIGNNNNDINDVVPAITKLPSLTYLDISNNGRHINDKSIEILAGLSKLTKLDIEGYFLNYTQIEKLSNLISCNIIFRNEMEDELVRLMQDANNPNINLTHERVKNMVFKLAPSYDSKTFTSMVINSPEKYPFAINSRDEEGHSLLHFYSHEPDMQQFLFQHGIIPEQKQQHGRLKKLAQDTQSVHTKEAVALTKFNTSKLVEAYGNIDTQQLLTKAEAYHTRLNELYKNDPDSVRLKLLSLPEGGKRNTMEKTLKANEPVPNDQNYVVDVIEKAKTVLTTKYLAKTNGHYNSLYHSYEIEYGDGHKITIPQSLGLVKVLIETMEIPVTEKQELLVTLMRQNPELVKSKLEIIQDKLNIDVPSTILIDSTKCHKFLASNPIVKMTPKIIDDLFNSISGLDIDQTWREQKEFILAEGIYIAATTYGDNGTACFQGVWDYIINSASEINKEFYNEFIKLQEQESKKAKEMHSITEKNIQEFTSVSAKKLIEFVKDKPELQGSLVDLGLVMIEVKNPQEITIEQQKILAEVNKAFTETIKKYLPNYNKTMPEFEEYNIIIKIIKELAENNALKQFVENYCKLQEPVLQLEDDISANSLVGALHQPTDEQMVEIIGSAESTGTFEL